MKHFASTVRNMSLGSNGVQGRAPTSLPAINGVKTPFNRGNWAVLSDEQMSNEWPFSLLNDEQMSNKVGVEHQPE